MSERARAIPHTTPVPGDMGYFRREELPDLGVVVHTSRYPCVDVDGQGRIPLSYPSVSVHLLTNAGDTPLYWRRIWGDDSDAALDARRQEVIDRLRLGTIRHDGTHMDIEDVAVEVYRYMEERLSHYEQADDIVDDTLDDPEAWPYNTLALRLRDDAYDGYDLWDEEEDDPHVDPARPRRVAERLIAAGVNWRIFGRPPTTDWIVRDMAHDIVARWEERRTAAAEGRLPSALAPNEREIFALEMAADEIEARGPGTTVDDVIPAVEAKLDALAALRKRAGR